MQNKKSKIALSQAGYLQKTLEFRYPDLLQRYGINFSRLSELDLSWYKYILYLIFNDKKDELNTVLFETFGMKNLNIKE